MLLRVDQACDFTLDGAKVRSDDLRLGRALMDTVLGDLASKQRLEEGAVRIRDPRQTAPYIASPGQRSLWMLLSER
jgi:hypothetical protein